MTPTGERPDGFEKLPNRFKQYLTHLEREVQALKEKLPQAGPTDVKIRDYVHAEAYLPEKTVVSFRLPDGTRDDHWVSVELIWLGLDRVLKVQSAWGGLSLLPSASNVAHVKINTPT